MILRLLLLLLLAMPGSAPAQSGMASPTRPTRKVKAIETDLPPITVDFRDVAVEAGLTAANVSGGEDRKQYILEATGNGVALFDYDSDGLLDIFLVNGDHARRRRQGSRARPATSIATSAGCASRT